ncbi:MAG: LysR family transcriptional regulator [Actinomycetota bacterium]
MASELTLRQVRYFLAAVDAGTMAGAAARLHVSASAVSLAVTAMEQVLDATLLVRTPHRPLALTPVGATVIGDLRRLLNASEDLVANARREAHDAVGCLRMGCFRTVATTCVPPLVAATAHAYPELELLIEELGLDELQEALLDGEIEIGVLYDLGLRPELASEVLTLTRPHILLGAEHPLAHRTRIRLRDLDRHPMVMLDVPPSKRYFESILRAHGASPEITRTTGSLETLRSLVARNQGWSMLIQRPDIAVSYEGRSIRTIEIADRLEPMPIVAAWPAGTTLTRRAQLVLDLCRQTIGRPAT